MIRWSILSGEYTPQPGGVSDYTRLVAVGLAAAGDEVVVYAPPGGVGSPAPSPGVCVRRLPDRFGLRGLGWLDRELARDPPDRILVQYVPHAFGFRAMNLPFAFWVAMRARRLAPVWVMFHEVASPLVRRPMRHNLLAIVNRFMARTLARAADRLLVSIPAWSSLLLQICPRARPGEWLPVPCNVATAADPTAVAAARARHTSIALAPLVGHFGTFRRSITDLLGPAVVGLLESKPQAEVLFIGRESERYLVEMIAAYPELAQRMAATGELSPAAVAAHLQACDVLLQPYADGVSSRRGSVMAGLANRLPVVTNLGALSEPLWAETSGAMVVSRPDPVALAYASVEVLALSSRAGELWVLAEPSCTPATSASSERSRGFARTCRAQSDRVIARLAPDASRRSGPMPVTPVYARGLRSDARSGHRLPGLDGLRMIAATMVVIYHADVRDGFAAGTWLAGPISLGHFGVGIFFVLSGFLITHLLMNEEQQTGRVGLKSFFIRRMIRIVPPAYFYIAIVLMLAWAGLVTMHWSDVRPSVFFYKNYAPTASITGHYWTLSAEEQFYLVWPLAFVALRTDRAQTGRGDVWCPRRTVLEALEYPLFRGRQPQRPALRPQLRFTAYRLFTGPADAVASSRSNSWLASLQLRLFGSGICSDPRDESYRLVLGHPQAPSIHSNDPPGLCGGRHQPRDSHAGRLDRLGARTATDCLDRASFLQPLPLARSLRKRSFCARLAGSAVSAQRDPDPARHHVQLLPH